MARAFTLTAEELQSIIATPALAPGLPKLVVELEEASAIIIAPHLDEDGDPAGNLLVLAQDDSDLLVMGQLDIDTTPPSVRLRWRKDESTPWAELDASAPKRVHKFAQACWDELRETLSEQAARITAFENHFAPQPMPELLAQLHLFERKVGVENFSQCFYLDARDDSGRRTWSEAPEFVNAFIEFATANGSGSSYALWRVDDDLSRCPVVVFGDEGGLYVVADDLRQWLALLTLDVEISVDPDPEDGASFYLDEDEQEGEDRHSDAHAEFVQWAAERGIKPIDTTDEANAIVQAAMRRHQPRLDAFLARFGVQNG